MIEKELIDLYNKTRKQLANLLNDMTFANFYRAIQSGKRTYGIKNTLINRAIDEDWVNAIITAIPHIDTIVNNPRQYMKRMAEVVPIEKARSVDSNSVKHLASHTNLISSVKNGMVRPNQILAPYNEESLELYENRFVMTLIRRVSEFVDRRYYLLGAGGNEYGAVIDVNGGFEQEGETVEYSSKVSVRQGAEYFEGGVSDKVYKDLFTIKKYVTAFRYSSFMKVTSEFAEVRPPIVKTNLLKKDPHYAACVELWDFIESYNKAGYKIEITDYEPVVNTEIIDSFDALNLLMYVALKNGTVAFDPRRRAMGKCKKKVMKPTIEETESGNEETIINVHSEEIGMHGGDAEREERVRIALVKALRNEQIKQEYEELELETRRKRLATVVEDMLQKQRDAEKEDEKRRRAILAQSLRDALNEERKRYGKQERAKTREERKIQQQLEKHFKNAIDRERAENAFNRREQRSQERVIEAVLADALVIENDRQYRKENPAVEFGEEKLPAPLLSQLPITELAPDIEKKRREKEERERRKEERRAALKAERERREREEAEREEERRAREQEQTHEQEQTYEQEQTREREFDIDRVVNDALESAGLNNERQDRDEVAASADTVGNDTADTNGRDTVNRESSGADSEESEKDERGAVKSEEEEPKLGWWQRFLAVIRSWFGK